MYGASLPLSASRDLPRIFAQKAYAVVRNLEVVPVVFFEALALAAYFPILWQRHEGSMQFITLRTIGLTKPPTFEMALPLILRAYPIRNEGSNWNQLKPCMDCEPADEPTDIGSPVFSQTGDFTEGTKHRARALVLFATNEPETQEMSSALEEYDMLVPWDLKERVADARDLKHEFFVAKHPASSKRTPEFLARYRQKGANLLTAHRLSMYRTSSLLSRAKSGAD